MRVHPFLRLVAAGAALWGTAGYLMTRTNTRRKSDGKHAAIDPRDPAVHRAVAPAAVRSADPQGMRTDDDRD
jgi:hypothetical protein